MRVWARMSHGPRDVLGLRDHLARSRHVKGIVGEDAIEGGGVGGVEPLLLERSNRLARVHRVSSVGGALRDVVLRAKHAHRCEPERKDEHATPHRTA